MSASTLPLAGITVVALEQAVAGPLATRHLADLGARVVKIERPGEGDFARNYDHAVRGLATHFVWLNRGKESLAVDLKSARGRRIAGELIARADVFLHNTAPGVVEHLGLDADTLRAADPSSSWSTSPATEAAALAAQDRRRRTNLQKIPRKISAAQ